MQISTTDIIATYAAIVATLVFFWDIAKWYRTGARFRVVARCHTFYGDSRVLKTTTTEDGEIQELAEYCHIEVTNTGDQPATILSIEATHKTKSNQGAMFCGGPQFTPHFGKPLPQVVAPGEVWSARIEMDSIYKLAKRGRPEIQLSTSMSIHPKKVKIDIKKLRPIDEK
jgi:hypothetical protein